MADFQPKGGMCAACTKRMADCSELDFANMPILHTMPDGTNIVRCTKYVPYLVTQSHHLSSGED